MPRPLDEVDLCRDDIDPDEVFEALMDPEVDDFIDAGREMDQEPHDYDHPLIVEHRGYTIEARRAESLGGDDNIYYSIIRKSDGYFVVDNFTSDETPVAEFVETVLKPMVDDIIKNPLDYYDSEEDYREGSPSD